MSQLITVGSALRASVLKDDLLALMRTLKQGLPQTLAKPRHSPGHLTVLHTAQGIGKVKVFFGSVGTVLICRIKF